MCQAFPPASAPPAPRGTSNSAPPPEVLRELPSARLFGSGRLRRFLFRVYDARLWTRPGFDVARFSMEPLALELEYGRSLLGPLIAERSIEEMRRGAAISSSQQASWLAAMQLAFPDVNEGDRMTGVQLPGVATRFFVNGKLTGEIRDAEFTRLFFGIWLGPHTSEPGLRAALLAGGPGDS
ncbi:MAG: hypothetical protein B7Y51_12520 [Burkholderiales bacterium 28-67-8]|nr:MAG: hypothetical protein B7Y51_12520 [Burkholderiales bacterium 28-67-8]